MSSSMATREILALKRRVAHGATRFVNPTTGRSVVVDNVTSEVIHVGADGFSTRVVTIYVRLLDEGTQVSRPTEALDLGNGLFKLLATPAYDPGDEKWEFPPESIVRVEKRREDSKEYLMAVPP